VRFQGWDKPDLVLVLTAQQHGYMLPCGCSRPQVGGWSGGYNFPRVAQIAWLACCRVEPRRRGPASRTGASAERAGIIKYRYSLEAMKRIGYLGVVWANTRPSCR